MNILITGAKGFIGKNLVSELNNIISGKTKKYGIDNNLTLFEYDIDTDPKLLDEYCKNADFVFHLAGVNRPKTEDEFMKGNFGFCNL
jgi:UDP-2-acetamido-2,6-beta-L-arabino-hexul-4-ose reductase